MPKQILFLRKVSVSVVLYKYLFRSFYIDTLAGSQRAGMTVSYR